VAENLLGPVADQDWFKIEYDQINQYGRTLYGTIQTLAQMTFVINPALGAACYYVDFAKDSQVIVSLGKSGFLVAAAIPILGILYNLGALSVYKSSHKCLEALLIRMKEIDGCAKLKLHKAIEVTAPRSYTIYWGATKRSYLDGDFLTRIFLTSLILLWAIILIASMMRRIG
jgi:hypothetical protein